MEIISIKTYSPMHKKIVNTCSHSNITVWVYILNIVKKSLTSPRRAIFSIYVGHHHCLADRTGQSVDLTVIGNSVFILSCDQRNLCCDSACLLFCDLQFMYIQYHLSNWSVFWLHNDRNSFLSSFLYVASSWTLTDTSYDDVAWLCQTAFAYMAHRLNALKKKQNASDYSWI